MPRNFENCVNSGGRVRTIKLPHGKFMRVCFPKGGGPSVAGEVRTAQNKDGKYPIPKMTSNAPLLQTLLDIMKDVDLRIFKEKGLYGQTNGQYIKTNTKKGDVVNTIIHELMHVNYPERSEKEIKEVSAAVEGSLTMRDQARLLDEYEGKVIREEDRKIMYPALTMASVARAKTQRSKFMTDNFFKRN